MHLLRATVGVFAGLTLLSSWQLSARACDCAARPPHAFGENGKIPANAEGVFLDLPKRGDFRVEASTVRDGKEQPCRSDLQNAPLPYLRELKLRCSLLGAQTLRVAISSHGKPLHTSEFKIAEKAALPASWGSFSAVDAKPMKMRVAETRSCQDTVEATGTTLRFEWSKTAAPWSNVALFAVEVDGQAFASQKHHLCDGHLAHLAPTNLRHTHLFATELAMEQQGAMKERSVGVQVLMPGQKPVRLQSVQISLPARLSGKPIGASTHSSENDSDHAAADRVSKIIERCRGKEAGEVVVKVKVSGLTGQVLSTQVRAPNTTISACVRKRTQSQKFEARGGGKDYEFEITR